MEVGQGLVVGEQGDFGHDAGEDVGELADGGAKVVQRGPVEGRGAPPRRQILHHQTLGAADRLLGRQIGQGQEETAFKVPLLGFERGAAFLVHQGRNRIGESGLRIKLRGPAHGLDVKAPARTQPPQRVVHLSPGGHELAVRGAGQVRPAKAQGGLESAVLVQDHPGRDQRDPGQVIEQPRRLGSVLA